MTIKIEKRQDGKTYRVKSTIYADTPRNGYTLNEAKRVKKLDEQIKKIQDMIDIIFWKARNRD